MRYLIVATPPSHILKFKYQKIADRLLMLNERTNKIIYTPSDTQKKYNSIERTTSARVNVSKFWLVVILYVHFLRLFYWLDFR